MAELIAPTDRLQAAWTRAHVEWGAGLHEDGFGLLVSDDVDSSGGFRAWVARISAQERLSTVSGPVGSGCPYRWIVDDDGAVLGGIAARWGDSEYISRNGHIGYGITPSARGRGFATWAL